MPLSTQKKIFKNFQRFRMKIFQNLVDSTFNNNIKYEKQIIKGNIMYLLE